MYLGPQVTRNRIDLSPCQLHAYLARQDFTSTPEQRERVSGGYIMVGYQGFTLGLGCLHAAAGRVESLYPRHMAVDAGHLVI
jgi:hypothetical protein